MKGGQAQEPLVKSVHIPLLSEGIQANPGLLERKGELKYTVSIKRCLNVFIWIFTNQISVLVYIHTWIIYLHN